MIQNVLDPTTFSKRHQIDEILNQTPTLAVQTQDINMQRSIVAFEEM